MMKKKRLYLVLIAILSLMACSSDDDNGLPREGLFISINNDSRKISGLFKKGKGELEVSAYGFDSRYDEPKGVQFVMDIYDPNKEYVGDIGGLYGCTEVEVFVDVFQTEFPDKNIKTVFNAYGLKKEEKQDKSEIFIRIKNISDDIIFAGTSRSGQNISVTFNRYNQFRTEFNNITFETNDGITFKASGRIITYKQNS